MTIELDHLILAVNDRAESVAFYTEILGLPYEGEREPFAVLRVTPRFVIQIAGWGTKGGQHLAFAMSIRAFDEAFERIKAAGVQYGDRYDAVGNMKGPSKEATYAARDMGEAVYFFDPNNHLIEIRRYDD